MKNKLTHVGILGVGQVSGAIKRLTSKYCHVLTKDMLVDNLTNKKIDILHVCVPYSNSFVDIVTKQIKQNQPKLIVINSTVKPGTSRYIFSKTNMSIVHSPIMGVHPRLYHYLFQFPKFIGPINKKSGVLASSHFKHMGLKTILFNNPEETELAKLLDTTYYGLNIVFSKWVKGLCIGSSLDFNNVYAKFNKAYNEGYIKTLPNVRRPILVPIMGPIGGTCVVPNAKILDSYISNVICKLIIDSK